MSAVFGRVSYEPRKAVMPRQSGAAFGSAGCQ
jgi:hypothetical protein